MLFYVEKKKKVILQKRGAGSSDGCGTAKGVFLRGGAPQNLPIFPLEMEGDIKQHLLHVAKCDAAALLLFHLGPRAGGTAGPMGEEEQKWVMWVRGDPGCNGAGPLPGVGGQGWAGSISHLLDFSVSFPFPPLGPSVLEPDLGDGGGG